MRFQLQTNTYRATNASCYRVARRQLTLRDQGVQIAIDDFGTGFSSLSYLRKFPIDALKIDQSFVSQVTSAGDETSIVAAVISMARSLQLRVVGEGVETVDQLRFLQAQDCDEVQGYFFGRPVPPGEFAELLRAGTIEGSESETGPGPKVDRMKGT